MLMKSFRSFYIKYLFLLIEYIHFPEMKSARAFEQTKICGLRSPRTLLTSEPLFGDPAVYVAGAMDEGDAFCLTGCEETNDIQVD